MEPEQYLARLSTASEALAAAATEAGTAAPVPSCPDWTVADLLVHMATGDRWVRTIIERRTTERVLPEALDAPEGDALVPWFLDGARELVDALAAIDPTTSVWTFSASDRTARFWVRRRANEVAVHCYDAQLAAGRPEPVDTAIAADGVDEYLTTFVRRFSPDTIPDGKTIHVHCTDAEGEWFLTGTADGAQVTREHAKGDVAVRGTASELVLFVWGRVKPSALEVFGDTALLEQFSDATHI